MIVEKVMTIEEIEAFRSVFKMPPPLEVSYNGLCFDIFAFDDYLHKRHGYDEDQHGSMKDFLSMKFGDGTMYLVEGMINSAFDPSVLEANK